jgi:serine/threonine-protein kinase
VSDRRERASAENEMEAPEAPPRLRHALRRRYAIVRPLGRGGSATVYLAEDLRYRRPVALKVLDPDLAFAMGGERFVREVQITAQLQHPHILPLLESGEAKGWLYAVMPYVEGQTLRDRLIEVGRLEVAEALLIGRETAEALDYAHRRGIIHRDIKPENILLSDGHAVVADFGIARAIGLAGGQSLTRGQPIGTLPYMSPEQALGDERVDAASDVYSLGCVLYEMLTGRIAFGGKTLREIVARQAESVPPVAALRPEVAPAVSEMVARAMAKNPAQRFRTAGELAASLRGLLGEPTRILTPPELRGDAGPGEGGTSPVGGRHRGRLTLVAAVAAVLALAALAVWPARERALARATPGPSVAVLPLEVRGTNPEDVYLGEGITEEVIARLAQVPGLKVISRTSVVALKDAKLTIPQIAETLGVRHVLEGSLQRAGARIQARVQLVDARTDATVWQQSYQLQAGDMFRLQDEVARQVAGALVSTFAARPPAMRSGTRTNRMGAYDALLRGRYWLARRTPEGLARAREAFEAALAQDSTYAPALAGLSSVHLNVVGYGFRTAEDPYTELAQAIGLADRAVRLDSTLVEAYHVRADARRDAGFPDSIVRPDMERVQRLEPTSDHGLNAQAYLLLHAGRPDSAMRVLEAAAALDPLAIGQWHSVAVVGLMVRRYEVALRAAQRALALAPADRPTHVLYTYTALLAGRPGRCADDRAIAGFAAQAMCLVTAHRDAEAARLVDSLATALDQERYDNFYQYADLGAYYAWRGDAAKALRWLQRLAAHSPIVPQWQLASGLFDRVLPRPEFRAGVEELRRAVTERVVARLAMGER